MRRLASEQLDEDSIDVDALLMLALFSEANICVGGLFCIWYLSSHVALYS
jgi:hypothetical protein